MVTVIVDVMMTHKHLYHTIPYRTTSRHKTFLQLVKNDFSDIPQAIYMHESNFKFVIARNQIGGVQAVCDTAQLYGNIAKYRPKVIHGDGQR